MIKKKLNILLLLSLALLSLNLLGTTCYARELTQDNIRNLFINFYKAKVNSVVPTNILNNINSADFSNWVSLLNSYQGKYIISAEYPNQNLSYLGLTIWFYTADNDRAYRYNQNGLYVVSSNNTRWRQSYYVTSNTFQSWSQGGNMSSVWNNQYYWYTDTNIWNQSSGGSVYTNAGYGYPSSDIFYENETPPPTSYFSIDINADFRDNKATISNDTSGTQYYLVPYTSDKVRIGNMFDYSNLSAVIKRKFRYKQSTRSFDLIQEYESNTNNLEFFDIADDTLIVFEYCQPDTTEFITFVPKTETGFSQFTVPIYYTSANTSVVNGVIDTGDTFSGDNYTNYNNDTNTDKIIDNINNDNEVDSTLNEFISGDAEDIANKFGFRLFNQEYYDFIYNTIVSITNVLTDDSDVYFDYSMHGEAPTRIYASSFTTPNGTLKTFLTMFLVSCTVFAFYKYIADLLELISTGNILEALDEFKVDRNIFKM